MSHSCMAVSHTAHDILFAITEQLLMPHTAYDSFFAITEQLHLPHIAVCQSLMQSMTNSLPHLNSYRCQTQLYAILSYSL